MNPLTVKRLNWGCGSHGEPGWINSDTKSGAHIDLVCDIRHGLPLETDSLDYVVSIHALPEAPYPDLIPILQELRRVIKPGGILRLSLPDLDKGIQAYQCRDPDYFLIPDEEAQSLGGKFIVQMLWYGYCRSLFTADFIGELLEKAGFREIRPCAYRETHSAHPGIIELDNRERESLFVEATK